MLHQQITRQMTQTRNLPDQRSLRLASTELRGDPLRQRSEHYRQGRYVRAASLRHVRSSTTLPAQLTGKVFDHITRFDSVGSIGCHARHQGNFSVFDGSEQDDARSKLVLALIQRSVEAVAPSIWAPSTLIPSTSTASCVKSPPVEVASF